MTTQNTWQIGTISEQVANLLGQISDVNKPILIGDNNVMHIKKKHFADYQKYGHHISTILSSPDYVGTNPSDGSIEYVKEFKIDNEFVKVAVRLTGSQQYFVRSLYVLNNNRVNNFIRKGTLKKV